MTAEVVHKDVLDGIREKMDHLYAVQDYYFPDTQAEKQELCRKLQNQILSQTQSMLDGDAKELHSGAEERRRLEMYHAEALSIVMEDVGEMEKAERELSQLVVTNPSETVLWERLGHVYVELGMMTEAKSCFEKISMHWERKDATDEKGTGGQVVRALCRLSQVLRYLARTDELQGTQIPLASAGLKDNLDRDILHSAIEWNDKSASSSAASFSDSTILASVKMIFDALMCARRAVEKDVSSSESWYMLANSYQLLYTSTIYEELAPFFKVYPGKLLHKAERAYSRSVALLSKAKLPKCLENCAFLDKQHLAVKNPEVYVNYAYTLQTQHKFLLAIQNLRTALSVDKTFEEHAKKQITLIRSHLQTIWRCIPRKSGKKSGRKLANKMENKKDSVLLETLRSLFSLESQRIPFTAVYERLFLEMASEGSDVANEELVDIAEQECNPQSIFDLTPSEKPTPVCTIVSLLSLTPVESPLHPPVVLIATDPTVDDGYVGIALLHLPPTFTGGDVKKILLDLLKRSTDNQKKTVLLRDVELLFVPQEIDSNGDKCTEETFPIALVRDPSQIWINGIRWPSELAS